LRGQRVDFVDTFQVLDLLGIAEREDGSNAKVVVDGEADPETRTELGCMMGEKSMCQEESLRIVVQICMLQQSSLQQRSHTLGRFVIRYAMDVHASKIDGCTLKLLSPG
jgi:hypothetical protein